MTLVDIPQNRVPPGATVRMIRTGAVTIRTAHWPARPAPGRTGTVLICTGRGEFIEKYAEVVGELLERGFAVAAFDWRGQGGSSRLLANPRKGHVARFDDYERDLAAVRAALLQPFCPKPWFALGHSMGGAVLIHHARHGSAFERIVLSAPMVDLRGLGLPRTVRALAALAATCGAGRAFLPGGSRRSAMTRPFAGNVLTSDPHRFAILRSLAEAAPSLTVGSPTWGWLWAAFRAMAPLADLAYARTIATPILTVGCGDDRVVDMRAVERFATRLKVGHLVVVPHARHEILMERDVLRAQFWAAFDAFVPGTADAA